MFTRIVFALVLSASIAPLGLAAESEVEPTKEWAGKTPDKSLKALAPKSGFVTSPQQWRSLWTAWRPGEELPKVDFTQQIVLVATVDGPNQVMLRPTLQEKEIRFIAAGTRMAGPGFGYRMVAVNKVGVTKVNGEPLVSQPKAQESIQVTVTGKLRTGLVAIGSETTGTTITANGITWELDLGQAEELRQLAETLNGKHAKVLGSLERKAGVEVAERWIVTVKRLEPVAAD